MTGSESNGPVRPAVLYLVDDDDASRDAMRRALERVGHTVRTFADGEELLERLDADGGTDPDAVISDVRMPGIDGYELLRRVRGRLPGVPFLLVTAYGDVDEAVGAMQEGADDYLTKPVKMAELRRRVQLHLERRVLSDENRALRERLDRTFGFERIIGRSEGMQELFDRMRVVAPTRTTVLVVGESGTGKELVANALHQVSPRAEAPFVAVNCGAIPGEILESELFGHEKGAFTGAHQRRIGLVETAAGGTLFLDEISELSPELQVKLLRVLEDRRVVRVGGSQPIPVDFRLVAATNRNLEAMVEEGGFRQDLYWRLKVVTLELPPLRRRPEDVPLLVGHFLAGLNRELDRSVRGVQPAAMSALQRYPWPGNVRELRNLLESLVLFAPGEEIRLDDLPTEYRLPAAAPAQAETEWHPRTMAEIEREAILTTLGHTGGHRAKAAQLLGIGLRTLQRKLKEYGETGGRGADGPS